MHEQVTREYLLSEYGQVVADLITTTVGGACYVVGSPEDETYWWPATHTAEVDNAVATVLQGIPLVAWADASPTHIFVGSSEHADAVAALLLRPEQGAE